MIRELKEELVKYWNSNKLERKFIEQQLMSTLSGTVQNASHIILTHLFFTRSP